MGETAQIVALWRRCRAAGEPVALATVVHVEGSSYRKPGARMLVAGTGERAGTVSGGCLEGEIARRIWWLTAHGPRVEQYQSSLDDDLLEPGGVPWGLGCGGTVWVLLEREPSAVLGALGDGLEESRAAVIVAALGEGRGTQAVLQGPAGAAPVPPLHSPCDRSASAGTFGNSAGLTRLPPELQAAAVRALAQQANIALDAHFAPTSAPPAFLVEYLGPAPRLSIFGAGDDAQPISAFAEALGWRVAVADGRSHLLRRERFPAAAELRLLTYGGADAPLACSPSMLLSPAPGYEAGAGPSAETPGREPSRGAIREQNGGSPGIPATDPGTSPGDFAVVLTHSYEQDRALLAALLPRPLRYLGVLGPRHRTLRLLAEVAPTLGWSVDNCLARLRAPVGLDLGARDPASIALAIVAEMQATLTGRQVAVTRGVAREEAHA